MGKREKQGQETGAESPVEKTPSESEKIRDSILEFARKYCSPRPMSDDDRLWELFVARVAKAELIHTMRRDPRVIFKESYIEAKVALDTFKEMQANQEVRHE